ncbi:MAG: hypothetical protein LC775_18130 [Acidobacteria bacterium]|nr:hypothetical protein [Acidobacteriota bacterium]
MRLATLFFMALISVGTVYAQRPGPQFRRPLACEPFEPRTKLEAVDGRYERILLKGFSRIATIRVRGAEIRVDAVELRDNSASTKAMGIAIVMREADQERINENRAFVDYEEIDPLVKAIDIAAKVNETVTKLAGFEARYRTRGDFELAVFRQGRTSGTAASVTTGICDRVTGLLTLDELELLRAHIVEARTRLDEIK